MAKALVGVNYGKMTSQRGSERKHTQSTSKMSGRSGPPMVDVGGKKQGKNSLKAAPNHRFAKLGSVSQRHSHTGPSHHPTIGKQTGHGNWATHGIKRHA